MHKTYWGNRCWELNEEGKMIPSDTLAPGDPNWIDYASVDWESCALLKEGHPQRTLRQILHKQILEETLSGINQYKAEVPACILTHGGIASGKTSAIELFRQRTEPSKAYLHLDFDRMKRCLPEYEFMHKSGFRNAAQFTQEESAKLAGKALKKAIQERANLIYEGSLASLGVFPDRIREMRKKGYDITVISTHVSEPTGQQRAVKRFGAGGRYVPSKVVADTYQKCPQTLVQLKGLVDIVVLLNNELEGSPSRPVLVADHGNVQIIDKTLYAEYLETVGPTGQLT